MATIRLPNDFKEFLNTLNSNEVAYLLVGGYAVGYHGYPRATVDLDIWVAMDSANARRVVQTLRQFGFPASDKDENLLQCEHQIIRMGRPPMRIDLLTSVSGLKFEDAYSRRHRANIGGVEVSIISIEDLRRNKSAAGRSKDLNDLEQLPGGAAG